MEPNGSPSLASLVEALRSPAVSRADVDALLTGLARPVEQGESKRERADLLLSLMKSRHFASMQGQSGQTVRATAVRAMMDLGHPYGLEIPPELLPEINREPRRARGRAVPWGGIVLGVLSLPGALWLLWVLAIVILVRQPSLNVVLLVALLAVLVVPVASVVMAIVGGAKRKRKLQEAGVAGLIALTIFWLMFALWAFSNGRTFGSFGTLMALAGMAQFVLTGLTAFLLRRPGWAPED
ncbi:MAG TPA: hypothetical protein VK539_28725 [Myxococcaceae bacterium]|nr:hypothetical protein [Myxococcaceae bacterium]